MKLFDKIVFDIRQGYDLNISEADGKYYGCLIKRCENQILDWYEIDISDFLNKYENIKEEIKYDRFFILAYIEKEKRYLSAIVQKTRYGGYQEPVITEVVEDKWIKASGIGEGIEKLNKHLKQSQKSKKALYSFKVLSNV